MEMHMRRIKLRGTAMDFLSTLGHVASINVNTNTNPRQDKKRQDKAGPDGSTSMQRLGPRIRSSACWRCSTSL
jgi:hypothetical protein